MLQIYGQLTPDQIMLERKYLWDIIRVDWREVFVTLNWTIIQLPILVKIPLRDKYRLRCKMRKRSFLLHAMLRQGMSWYALGYIEYLLPPLHLEESEICLQKMSSEMMAFQPTCEGLPKIYIIG